MASPEARRTYLAFPLLCLSLPYLLLLLACIHIRKGLVAFAADEAKVIFCLCEVSTGALFVRTQLDGQVSRAQERVVRQGHTAVRAAEEKDLMASVRTMEGSAMDVVVGGATARAGNAGATGTRLWHDQVVR